MFDVALSNVGGDPYDFPPPPPKRWNMKKIYIKSNLAPCGIRYHAESYAHLFFYEKRRARRASDSTSDRAGFKTTKYRILKCTREKKKKGPPGHGPM